MIAFDYQISCIPFYAIMILMIDLEEDDGLPVSGLAVNDYCILLAVFLKEYRIDIEDQQAAGFQMAMKILECLAQFSVTP